MTAVASGLEKTFLPRKISAPSGFPARDNRLSTKDQVEEGNSLATQEKNCREYAIKNEVRTIPSQHKKKAPIPDAFFIGQLIFLLNHRFRCGSLYSLRRWCLALCLFLVPCNKYSNRRLHQRLILRLR